jgi:hypothetical protein
MIVSDIWIPDEPMTQANVENVNGVWWNHAPIPRRWHRCQPQTRGWVNGFDLIERCACGAARRNGGRWRERNGRLPSEGVKK